MRLVIAIGCDTYEKPGLNSLVGAENDAKAIFRHLVQDNFGECSAAFSRLLLSPSMAELRSAVEAVLFSEESIEELTFFFAGHGGVKDGTYYLCLRDSDVDRMSVNALSMTQLFAWVAETKIGHTNLIIDACQSGGVVHDIGVLLNPQVIGKAGSIAISILAASGSNEYAYESNGAGHCTTALLECLNGSTVVQTTRPSLDLVEVGQVVSRRVKDSQQTPVCWGINLFGVSRLAKNPRFAGTSNEASSSFPGYAADGGNEHIRAASDSIWERYLALSKDFDADRFLNVVQPVCDKLTNEPAAAAAFVMGLSTTFATRAAILNDSFEIARVHAACAVALLPLAISSAVCSDAIEELGKRVISAVGEGVQLLDADLKEDIYALLTSSGPADYFFLPLRVMNILGWIGAAVTIASSVGVDISAMRVTWSELVRLVCGHYRGSLVPLSEELAPFYLAFASAAATLECNEEIEMVSRLFLRGLHDRQGHLAETGLSGEEAFRFLTVAAEDSYENFRDLQANPTSLLPAVILVLKQIGLSGFADGAMRGLDRTNINFFIPDDFGEFGAKVINEGTNITLKIGHAVFSVDDISAQWEKLGQGMSSNSVLTQSAVRIGCLLAALVRPDRVPWFLIAGEQAAEAKQS